MFNTDAVYPFWKTKPEQVQQMLASLQKGKVHTLCISAGGHEIPYVTYGEKPDYKGKANHL